MLPSSRWVPPGEQDPLGDIRNRSRTPRVTSPAGGSHTAGCPGAAGSSCGIDAWCYPAPGGGDRTPQHLAPPFSSHLLHPDLPTPVPRGQSPSEDSAVDHWPRRSCFPRTPRHHVGSLHKSGRAMKYYTRFRFISADRLASFAEPIKALNDAIHQRADRTSSDRGPGNFASLGPSANSLSDPCFH